MSEEGFPTEQNVFWLLPYDESAAISIYLVCHLLHLCTSTRPAWSGMMQMVHTGDNPGESSVLLLPQIDLDPSNMSCVHSHLDLYVSMLQDITSHLLSLSISHSCGNRYR